ncbi:hypothetical protein [Streptacidiphilus rugosus]|uniref:hypothetical protein n=1 Tax=Streptacidiphilus rugosus TaxID=405783 RepID=UPI00068CCBAE|nr:hypothetical protein [Streptacidiphilus rugosus]
MAGTRPAPSEDPAEDRARSLLARIRREPSRMPEELAVFAVQQMGPRAGASVERLRSRLPDADPELLREQVIAHGVRTSVTEGAFVGGPFLAWIPVAFCRALLAQAQLLLEVACLAGRDPRASERAAELLVLQGAYPDTGSAAAALARAAVADAADAASAGHRGGRPAGLWRVTMRMASILGLRQTEATRSSVSRLRHAGQWLLLGLVIVVGMVAPLVWLPYMAVSYRRSGRAIAERASVFYFGAETALPNEAEGGAGADPGLLAAVVRAVASLLLVVALVALVLLTGARLADQEWPVLGLVLAGSSIAVGAVWQLRRRARDRRAA